MGSLLGSGFGFERREALAIADRQLNTLLTWGLLHNLQVAPLVSSAKLPLFPSRLNRYSGCDLPFQCLCRGEINFLGNYICNGSPEG